MKALVPMAKRSGIGNSIYHPVMQTVDRVGFRNWRAWATARARGRVLEIGAGTGLNFAYYDAAARVLAFDPELDIADEEQRANIALLGASAEALPFPDESFDAAVGTLVFCSIPDAPRALAEVKRVLKPGASLRLVEHVRVENRVVAFLQDALTPLWKSVAGGCHLNRDTHGSVRAAGFEIVAVHKKWSGVLMGIEARKG